ncbi:MAG: hypothetical protein ABI726_08145 [bacterium]
MIGAYASVAVVCLASVVVGQAALSLAGRRDLAVLAGAVGLALLLTTAGIAVRLPGHATAVAAALALIASASAVFLWASRPAGLAGLAAALPAMLVALAVASIPFVVAGRVGILGVGLVNDDMASHLLLASWLDERFLPEPVLIDQGYPLGPHALVAGLAKALGTDPVRAFAGLTLAIPALTALVAFGALDRLRPPARTLAAAATALPYLVAAYLAQEAFKEPILALFVVAFALLLAQVRSAREAAALGIVAAGVVYVYSFPGLVWLAGTVVVWGAIELVRRPQPRITEALVRRAALAGAVALAVALALVAPDIGRVVEFADFRALDPSRANEGGLGNLGGHLSPLEGLGIWPTSEFRLGAGSGGLPAIVFYAGAALGALALGLGLPRWLRRYGPAVPAALVTALVVYAGARAFGTVYTSAKALVIAAPLITLTALGGLLDARPVARMRLGVAVALLAGIGLSSFLVLRQAPVGPTDHASELARIRPIVEGEKVLFLGRDNFVLYELRGSRPFTHVRNFYDPYFVKPDFELANVGSKFDFDSVTSETLARFPYVITTRASYASGPPPGYEAVEATDSYVLWRQARSPEGREPVEPGAMPTAELDCRGRRDAPAGVTAFAASEPVRAEASGWSPLATIEDGAPATITIDLPPGTWALSLQYDATRPVTLAAPGLETEIPGNLDYRGVAPFWPAGMLESQGGPVEVTATVESPPLAGRLLGTSSVAHLGAIAATAAGPTYAGGGKAPLPGLGGRLAPARFACGEQADWLAPAPGG